MSRRARRTAGHVVVVGGSIAGMLAAAAVVEHVESVEVVEAHALPAGAEPRAGVPQAAHIHWLQSGGAEAVESLLPGSIDRLTAAGARRIPVTTDMVIHSPEGWYRRWEPATHFVISASRDLTDSVIRGQVLSDSRVRVRARTRVIGLTGGDGTVTGVRVRGADGAETELRADLVVDASGRGSRLPEWLRELGVHGLVQDRVDSGLAYASRFYRAPVPTRGWPVVGVQADPRLPGPANAGAILPVEGGHWHVSLMGAPGGRPTRDAEDFLPFARRLRHPVLAELLEYAEPLTGVSVARSTANRRNHYERLRAWPEGLVALGDSVATFNPVYAQGMSVAALGALALRDAFSAGPARGRSRRAQRAVGRPIDAAWALAVGQDMHFPTTEGRRPNPADRLLHRYVGRLSRTATGSFRAATALTDVLALQAPPASLVRPGVLLTALRGPSRPQLDRPPFTPAELALLAGSSGHRGTGGRRPA
ncbi:NAD(P)/FAD-dependent oxidoreductase [Streptomyces sp. NPDC086023]|uniref:NAD(P)/FAD-dependent oxidoreductase n=1 Tax=Streptomyces sp. NPDC086023 TaxID=3365746 RepID=UPI0037D811E4